MQCFLHSRENATQLKPGTKHRVGSLRWSRPFGQFCGLDKLYPVVVMPPF
ncbi:hypothetical protein GOB81_16315 [Acetobacter sp. LMG 1627]|uniref:Transposase n=1 Tax=Acetobacter conturbans TaxID=1737472 RepID=A0ABX0K4T5_9PROT|nr:hypothetical protein [Acetobacter conturbans]